jgi:hypothetical protein
VPLSGADISILSVTDILPDLKLVLNKEDLHQDEDLSFL